MVTLNQLRTDPEKVRDGVEVEWYGLTLRIARKLTTLEFRAALEARRAPLRDKDGVLSPEDDRQTLAEQIAADVLLYVGGLEEINGDGARVPVECDEAKRLELLLDDGLETFLDFVVGTSAQRELYLIEQAEALAGN